MDEKKSLKARGSLGKLFVLATIISGVIAAYLMHKRGAPVTTIATETITNPLGSLASEVKSIL
jgi:hypothetical protein